VALLAGVAAVALSVAGYFYLHRTPELTDKDTIVLADFTNTTGDPVFDGTLRQGLAAQLEQSPSLSLISEQQIQQALQMMGQKPDVKLTPEIALELCQRTSSCCGSRRLDSPDWHAVSADPQGGQLLKRGIAGEHGSSSGRQKPSARCARKDGFGHSQQAGQVAEHCAEI
jgi:hypothetical protein